MNRLKSCYPLWFPCLFAILIAAAIPFSLERAEQKSAPVTAATPTTYNTNTATDRSKLAGQFQFDAHTIIDGQPDGSEIHLKDYSTEELTLQTTLDGFTVVRSHYDGFYYYARLSENGSQLVPTDTKATAKPSNDLERHITVAPENIRHICGNSRLHNENQGGSNAQSNGNLAPLLDGQSIEKSLLSTAPEFSAPISFAYTSGSVGSIGQHTGLTIVIGFPDDPAVTGDQSYLPRVEGVTGGTSVSYVDKIR